jgi:O-antigen ligase
MTVRFRVPVWADAAAWAAAAVALATVVVSLAFSPETTWKVVALAAGLGALAIVRPGAGLLMVAAFAGFGSILALLTGAQAVRMTEVLVVVALLGGSVDAARRPHLYREALGGWIMAPVLLFALAATASTAVWLRVEQVRTGYAAEHAQRFFRFLTHDYFTAPGEFWVVVSTAVVLEGLGLFVLVAALCRIRPAFFEQGARMLIVGSAGLGAMSLVRLGEILLRNPEALAALRASVNGLRISPQIPDYIAAGSYFSLCWLVSIGVSASAPLARRPAWLAAGVPAMAALYLTGSRSVIAAALAGLVFFVMTMIRRRAAAARGVAVVALVAVAVMAVSYRQVIGRDAVGQLAKQSLTVRFELLKAGWSVMSTRPLFGVGLDRFFLVAGDFATPELRAMWPGRLNPHNDFLRFAGELGAVGVMLFVWILGLSAFRIWRGLRGEPDVGLAGVAAGLIAFLVTSCVSNPLMVREVSYVFWIALGLAVGRASGAVAPAQAAAEAASHSPGPSRRLLWPVVAATAALLTLTVPMRASTELAAVNMTRVSYGLFEWGVDTDGTPTRWSGPRATFFVDGRARSVELSFSGAQPAGVLQQVEIRLDGRVANRLAVGGERQHVRLVLPPGSGAHRRIDLTVTPTWVPADLIPGNPDRRELGVKVGELRVQM